MKRIECGWPGHYIGANYCGFSRNTLLKHEGVNIIVSSVGAYVPKGKKKFDKIGLHQYYETVAFHATSKDGMYYEIDTERQIPFDSPWMIEEYPKYTSDSIANTMHDTVVDEIESGMLNNEYER